MYKIALINPNSNAATTDTMVAIARDAAPSALFTGLTARLAPAMITTAAALDASAPEVVEMAPGLAGYDAVIVAAFGDPGAVGLARTLAIPVIGIGAAAARAAAQGGVPFAVATTTPGLAARIDALMQAHAGAARYVGCFTTKDDPLRLMDSPDALDAALLRQIDRAGQAGARRVIIGGGPLGAAARRLAPCTDMPLVQPIPAAVAACLARLRPA